MLTTNPLHSQRSEPATPAAGKHHILGRGVLAALASVLLMVALAAPVDARVTTSAATMRCGGGQVVSNVPHPPWTKSTHARTTLVTRSDLYVQTRSGWQYVDTSGWWAVSVTDQNGTAGYWFNADGHYARWHKFHTTPGRRYAVRVHVWDMADGTNYPMWATLNGSTTCVA